MFDSKFGQTNHFKNRIHNFPASRSALKRQSEKQAGKFVPLKKPLAGFPKLGVVNRWPATPKRARIAPELSRDKKINMQLNKKKTSNEKTKKRRN